MFLIRRFYKLKTRPNKPVVRKKKKKKHGNEKRKERTGMAGEKAQHTQLGKDRRETTGKKEVPTGR